MKIEVTHTVKFDAKVESLVELIAKALINAAGEKAVETTVEPAVVENEKAEATVKPEKEDKLNVAEKTRYFVHEGSDELVVVKKGESLDFLETDIFDEVSAAVYKQLLAKQQEAESEQESEAKHAEESQPELKIDDIRAIAAKFVNASKQKELKNLFDEFMDADGSPCNKLSSIQQKDYPGFKDRATEILAELGVE